MHTTASSNSTGIYISPSQLKELSSSADRLETMQANLVDIYTGLMRGLALVRTICLSDGIANVVVGSNNRETFDDAHWMLGTARDTLESTAATFEGAGDGEIEMQTASRSLASSIRSVINGSGAARSTRSGLHAVNGNTDADDTVRGALADLERADVDVYALRNAAASALAMLRTMDAAETFITLPAKPDRAQAHNDGLATLRAMQELLENVIDRETDATDSIGSAVTRICEALGMRPANLEQHAS